MKKILTLAVVAIFGAILANAQTALIATLSHNGEITVFNGSGALIDAHKAAVNGDVITLSPGTFSATTLSKAITIRGAGMFAEENGTNISGSISINALSDTIGNTPMIEGVSFNEKVNLWATRNLTFSKCKFSKGLKISTSTSSQKNLSFINSFINEEAYFYSANSSCVHSISFVNSAIINPKVYSGNSSTYAFTNCYIKIAQSYELRYSTITNSIIVPYGDDNSTSTNSLINNIILTSNNNYLQNCVSVNNTILAIPSDLWKDESRYVLNDQYAKEWLGNDGTQVGIYGGLVPFDPTPAGPQITKFNVGQKTSADGKLTVDIEVKTAD